MGLAVLVTSPPRETFRFALLTMLAALPGLIAILPLLGSNADSGQWEFLARVVMPYHLDPVRPRVREIAVLALVMPVFLLLHYRSRRGDATLRTILLVQGGLWLIFAGGLAARVLHGWTLLQIFPFRAYPVLTLLFFFLALVAAFRTWRTARPPAVLVATAVVLLLWMPNPAPALWRTLHWCRGENAGGYCQGWGVRHDDLALTFDWIRHNTPEGSVVLAPPWRKDVFFRTRRATVANWHQVPYGRVTESPASAPNEPGRFASQGWLADGGGLRMSGQPLISAHGLDDVLAWRPSGAVTVRDFLADAQAVGCNNGSEDRDDEDGSGATRVEHDHSSRPGLIRLETRLS
jgi:hypothetical protein